MPPTVTSFVHARNRLRIAVIIAALAATGTSTSAFVGLANITQLASGAFHTCVINSVNSGARCWGGNSQGQLGDGSTVDTALPSLTDVATGIAQIDGGAWHTCALTTATSGVRCWGLGIALGIDGSTNLRAPPTTDVLTGVKQVYAGDDFTCVIMLATSGVRCWGTNYVGQLGNGGTATVTTPPTSDVLVGVQQMSLGGEHVCVVLIANTGVRCWGRNSDGQLGTGDTVDTYTPPTTDIITGVSAVSSGGHHTCILVTATAGVRCWGDNTLGQLGNNGIFGTFAPPATDVITGVLTLASGYDHVCVVLLTAGGVRCWGSNLYGQLGNNGVGTSVKVPPAMDAITGVSTIVTGWYHTCAQMADTTGVRCWGKNGEGQLGDASTNSAAVPPTADVVFTFPTPSTSITPTPSTTPSTTATMSSTTTPTISTSPSQTISVIPIPAGNNAVALGVGLGVGLTGGFAAIGGLLYAFRARLRGVVAKYHARDGKAACKVVPADVEPVPEPESDSEHASDAAPVPAPATTPEADSDASVVPTEAAE